MPKEYIEREEIKQRLEKIKSSGIFSEDMKQVCLNVIEEVPSAEVVSKDLYEQIKYERDTAVEQLHDMGLELGQKADVVEVVRCKECKNYELMTCNNQHFCNRFGGYVTEEDFCSRGVRKDG